MTITVKKPIIVSLDKNGNPAPIFSQGDYDVFVGTLSEDKLPQYVGVNRSTGVVEFTTEVTAAYKEWLNHFVPQEAPIPGGQLNLSLAN